MAAAGRLRWRHPGLTGTNGMIQDTQNIEHTNISLPDPRTLDYLRALLGFVTVTRGPNLDLIDWVRGQLDAHGIAARVIRDDTGTKANLHAWVGPQGEPGIMLSGHTDVVPAEGQDWTVPPYAATERDGRVYGRGAADMKGFVACALAALVRARGLPLKRPLHLALSYDEEIGCVGVRRMLDALAAAPVRPSLCIVGEPTSMDVALGHKGKMALRAVCTGRAGHSALAPKALSAIHLACDFVDGLRGMQAELRQGGAQDADYEIPYSTVHVGCMHGGTALNIVPDRCTLDLEIRHLAGDDPAGLLARLAGHAERIAAAQRERFPEAGIALETVNAYPGLDTRPDDDAVGFVQALLPPGARRFKVAFGTEGGLFRQALDVPVVVCGPGSMDQGHKPDEYVTLAQLRACDDFLARLTATLAA